MSQTLKRNRSSSYPALSLEKAVNSISTIKRNLGLGPFDRESAAKALGYRGISGPSSTAIAALVYYGLLERKGDSYFVSDTAQDILTPKHEGDEQRALIKAASTPKLFKALIERFTGQRLPSMIDHILVRDYGISDSAVIDVKKNFISTMAFADLLDDELIILANVADNAEISQRNNVPADTVAEVPTRIPSTIPESSSQQVAMAQQSIQISKGISLNFLNAIPIELLMDQRFASALKTLKEAVDDYQSTRRNSSNELE